MAYKVSGLPGHPHALERELGVIIAVSQDSYDSRTHRLPLRLLAVVEPDSIEWSVDGHVCSARSRLEAHFDPLHWDIHMLGRMHKDRAIERDLNAYIAALGFKGHVRWSHTDNSDDSVADLDMEPALVCQMWPDLVPACNENVA